MINEYKRAFYGVGEQIEDKETDTEYSTAVIDGVRYISFQGSVSKRDWLQNFNFLPKKYEGRWYHRGILKKWLAVKDDIVSLLDEKPLVLTGFSQGGGVAAIAHVNLIDNFHYQKCITFGAPRVIYSGQDEIDGLKVVTNTKDIVPMLPPFVKGLGNGVSLEGKYNIFHVYKNHMGYEELIDES